LPLLAIIKAIACIKIDKQPLLLIDMNGDGLPDRVFDQNPNALPGFFVYLNTGNGFDSGKQWQSSLGGDYNWKNHPTCVGRFFQLSPRLACHCLPLSKPSPVLR
jgi:hypothetical protein